MTDDSIAKSLSPIQRALIMASIMVATMIFVMNVTNVIVALPHMQGTFSATQDQIAWVLTSYIVALTIVTTASGWLSARFGRKRLFLISIGGFAAASFMCGTAGSLEEEVLYRMLQGALGAPVLPLSQAIVFDTFPREQHGSALGIWGMGITIGPVLGPIIGGYLTENYGWPWVFYFNLPFGVALVLAVAAFVPATDRDRDRGLDWAGFLALAVALSALQLLLNRGQRLDWLAATEIVVELVLAGACFYLFVVHTMTTRHPFIERAILSDRNVVLGFFFIFGWGMMLHSPLVLLSLRLQNLGDYPVMTVGYLMAPRGVGGLIAMSIVGPLIKVVNPKHVIVFGFMCSAVAAWIMSGWPMDALESEVILAGFVFGFGNAISWVPLSMLTFATLDPRLRTEGVVFFNLVFNMGSGIGITIAIIVFTHSMQINHAALTTFVTPYNEVFQDPSMPDAWRSGATQGLLAIEAEIQRQAATIAFNNSFRLIMFWALLISPFIYHYSRKKAGP